MINNRQVRRFPSKLTQATSYLLPMRFPYLCLSYIHVNVSTARLVPALQPGTCTFASVRSYVRTGSHSDWLRPPAHVLLNLALQYLLRAIAFLIMLQVAFANGAARRGNSKQAVQPGVPEE